MTAYLDGLVSGSGDDLTVVRGERARHHVLGVSDETAGALGLLKVPETEGSVPGGGESVLGVGRDLDVLDEVGVSVHALLGVAVLTSGLVLRELPLHNGAVCGVLWCGKHQKEANLKANHQYNVNVQCGSFLRKNAIKTKPYLWIRRAACCCCPWGRRWRSPILRVPSAVHCTRSVRGSLPFC